MNKRRARGDLRPRVSPYEWLLIAAGLLGTTISGWEAVIGVAVGLAMLRRLNKPRNR